MSNTADIICIVDRSGSMMSIRDDAIGGFNSMLEEQKAVPGEASVTLVLFDHEILTPIDRMSIKDVPPLTQDTFVPRGSTALLDAIGVTLNKARQFQPKGPDHKWIVVIITDGQENSSREWNRENVKKLTDELTDKGWEFVYVAANQDAFAVGAAMGVANSNTMNFTADSIGTRSAYASTSETLSTIRNRPSS